MSTYGPRVVIDHPFEIVLGATCRAVRDEGFEVLARIDVRDHFWRALSHNFGHYMLVDVWSPASALDGLEHEPDAGVALITTLAIYELGDSRTGIVARESLSAFATDPAWRRNHTRLAAVADRERESLARALNRIDGIAATSTVNLAAGAGDCDP